MNESNESNINVSIMSDSQTYRFTKRKDGFNYANDKLHFLTARRRDLGLSQIKQNKPNSSGRPLYWAHPHPPQHNFI